MSIIVDEVSAGRLRQAVEWLCEVRAAVTYHTAARISGMSDKELKDIGLKPRSLTSTVYREIRKPGLVDFGWRLGR